MEKKDYNNFVKSMELSNNWYHAGEELARELRYGLFEPSNELIIEFMEARGDMEVRGCAYLAEVIRGCEYTKNVELLYILTEFLLAKCKEMMMPPTTWLKEHILEAVIDGLLASLKTIYRLINEHVIDRPIKRYARILEDCNTNIANEKLKPMLDILLKQYLGYNLKLSESSCKIISYERNRRCRIEIIKSKYEGDVGRTSIFDSDDNTKLEFIYHALKTGMITIEADGTIKSPFIKADNGFKVEPDIIFMFEDDIQACVINEAIDDGKITMIEGMDFLKPEKSNEKNYKKGEFSK